MPPFFHLFAPIFDFPSTFLDFPPQTVCRSIVIPLLFPPFSRPCAHRPTALRRPKAPLFPASFSKFCPAHGRLAQKRPSHQRPDQSSSSFPLVDAKDTAKGLEAVFFTPQTPHSTHPRPRAPKGERKTAKLDPTATTPSSSPLSFSCFSHSQVLGGTRC